MSLYAGLENDETKSGADTSKPAWEANLKLLQSHIQLKKATLAQQRDKHKAVPPTSVISDPEKKRVTTKPVFIENISTFSHGKEKNTFFEDMHVEDEYNPLYPNDYEKESKEREEERERKREEERRRASEDRESRGRRDGYDGSRKTTDEEDDERRESRRDREKRSGGGAAIAPPPSLMETDTTNVDDGDMLNFTRPAGAGSKGLNVAAKIMEKYGYRQGGGLGKQEQGMSTALFVEKTGLRGGKIIHERDIPKDMPTTLAGAYQQNAVGMIEQEVEITPISELLKSPTKVVLLRNMIGAGEVDDELEPEIKEEMAKFGDVVNVLIFEMSNAQPTEAVRIFVEFETIEQAIKALVGLNGRFFGGRTVRASFYDVARYQNFELAD